MPRSSPSLESEAKLVGVRPVAITTVSCSCRSPSTTRWSRSTDCTMAPGRSWTPRRWRRRSTRRWPPSGSPIPGRSRSKTVTVARSPKRAESCLSELEARRSSTHDGDAVPTVRSRPFQPGREGEQPLERLHGAHPRSDLERAGRHDAADVERHHVVADVAASLQRDDLQVGIPGTDEQQAGAFRTSSDRRLQSVPLAGWGDGSGDTTRSGASHFPQSRSAQRRSACLNSS
jgi:hypothetical protein